MQYSEFLCFMQYSEFLFFSLEKKKTRKKLLSNENNNHINSRTLMDISSQDNQGKA